MSLADQSQVSYPTSVQVTVHQARNLRIKGKNGTNDAYAIMQVAKDKFSTSVAEKCVAPVWKEEATFDLPLFHHGNVERCTLYIIVNHRASVGLDKHLGQAVINLVELHEKSSRNKTEWFKLVDKNGKTDKDRGEVLLDIQFMRNNMSVSMFDLSMQDKPRSRIGKLKDKIRGKKKDGFSDSASAIVPSVTQAQSDSEGEGEAPAGSQGVKKKSKLKTLFAPKSNLQRNVSQSMSTLGSLPDKNSTLSGSRSSGLNIDSPELKKKFKFLTHKRTGSTDSKGSQGPFSLLSRSKQNVAEPNNVCINGSHVYTEEPEGRMSKGSSTLSLNSSDHGSVEDLRRTHGRNDSDFSADSIKGLSLPSYKPELRERTLLQQQQRKGQEEAEEQERQQAEEKRRAEAKRLQEEQEKRGLEDARLAEEERLQEEARKQEALRQLEEARRAEEQKQQEELSMSNRLSSLFGIGRKKDEKKEEEKPKSAPPATEASVSPSSSNPFEEIPLSSDTLSPIEESPADHQRGVHSLQTPSSGFPGRTAKVSAVKPSFSSNAPDMFSNMHNSMAPPQVRRNSAELLSTSNENLAAASPSTKRRVLLPPNYQSPVSNANTPTPAQAETHNPLPRQPKATPRSLSTAASVKEEIDGTGDPGRRSTQKNKGPTIPLPDYDALYPKRIHGIQGQMKWDHIVAEVTQRQRDYPPELIGKEVSVDEPSNQQDLPSSTPRDRSALPGKTTGNLKQAESEEGRFSAFKRMGSGNKHAFTPPKRTTAAPEKVKQDPSTRQVLPTVDKPNDLFAARVLGGTTPKVQNSSVPQAKPRLVARDEKKVLNTSVNIDSGRDALPKESQWTPEKVGRNSISAGGAYENPDNQAKEVPSITPRQRPVNHKSGKVLQMGSTAAVLRSAHEDPSTDTAVQGDSGKMEKLENSNVIRDRELFTSEQTQAAVSTVLESRNMPKQDLFEKPSELFPPVEKVDDNPFPSEVILAKDPWALPVQRFEGDDLFTGGPKREVKPDEAGMTTDDMEKLFGQKDERDPFSYFDPSDPVAKFPEQDKTKDNGAGKHTPGDQRASSSKKSRAPLPPAKPDNTRGAVDPFSPSSTSSPRPITSSLVSPEPLKAVADVGPQPSGTSGGKAPLRAWVSPSEAQAVAGQSRSGGMAVGKGGEPASTPRRPHPVKPMSSLENQAPASISFARDIKSSVIRENVPEKMKVSSSVESGPYSQLTQDELISLVVKQQDELSKKNGKILELEDYIDNLLVHVIDEKPSILLAMANTKKAI
ncbi:rab11 family-interacting protein 1 isoform X1 [Anguilla rostrata]|uniref:rab11 family-interacting protein 1 isoform X1 n=1 Tax=Anguilla rostrata TaxID=7938 RepID=UPI0030D513B9